MDAVIPLSLEAFLGHVERRAYRMALLATREPADAMDIVQDTMLNLVQHYRHRPHHEWGGLFHRMLHNRILDWQRRQSRQRRWFYRSSSKPEAEPEEALEQIPDPSANMPAEILARADDVETVLRALGELPFRQQQAFLLRAWEGYDVATTAKVMECSEGSVKTHYFRALQVLRAALQEDSA